MYCTCMHSYILSRGLDRLQASASARAGAGPRSWARRRIQQSDHLRPNRHLVSPWARLNVPRHPRPQIRIPQLILLLDLALQPPPLGPPRPLPLPPHITQIARKLRPGIDPRLERHGLCVTNSCRIVEQEAASAGGLGGERGAALRVVLPEGAVDDRARREEGDACAADWC